jgi:hypothetical protein
MLRHWTAAESIGLMGKKGMKRQRFLGLFVSPACSAMAKPTRPVVQNGQTGIASKLDPSLLESAGIFAKDGSVERKLFPCIPNLEF